MLQVFGCDMMEMDRIIALPLLAGAAEMMKHHSSSPSSHQGLCYIYCDGGGGKMINDINETPS